MSERATTKFAPASLSEVVFADNGTQAYFQSMASKKILRDIILYGPTASGKTSIANLLPKSIDPNVGNGDLHYINCSEYRTIDAMYKKVNYPIKFAVLCGGERHYVILNEVDALSKDAMAALKTIIEDNHKNALFILLTNTKEKIIREVRSRCDEISIHYATADRWLPHIKKILKKETNKTVPDERLLDVIRAGEGDGRKIHTLTEDLILDINSRALATP